MAIRLTHKSSDLWQFHSGVKATWTIRIILHLSFPWNHRQSI